MLDEDMLKVALYVPEALMQPAIVKLRGTTDPCER
jgi:hypothetical protein